jgi:NitT/TauT family transport system ATP-binding protein
LKKKDGGDSYMEPAIRMQGVTQVYVTAKQASLAVASIDFRLLPGQFVSLVGPSGCGKTTILSMIAGLIEPTEGIVELFGRKVDGPSSRVGYMLQQDYLFPWRSIWENALVGLELRKELTAEKQEYALHLLEEMGLADHRDHRPHQLSGGMRQRVALVRTLATEPDVLLLDEPFSALDYQTKLQLEDLVVELLKAKGKSALLVTHDLSEAIAMSDRVIVLDTKPGRVRKEILVPEGIRMRTPFEAREQPGFHDLFREVWQELEAADGKEGPNELKGKS